MAGYDFMFWFEIEVVLNSLTIVNGIYGVLF